MSAPASSILPNFYIGLMSGTSLDSIDAVIVRIEDKQFKLVSSLEYTIPEILRQQLIDLCQPGNNEIDRMGAADRALGKEFAKAVKALLEQSGRTKSNIMAIGSHGQTIRHRPYGDKPSGESNFTLQIADPNTIAFETGINTVADFRRRDIAAGGQGAPLAPAFHKAAFSSSKHNRAIINIGGMANITYLGSDGSSLGFDTGPGNILMDSWIQKILNKKYDHHGNWAASGMVNKALLSQLLNHPYFEKSVPKSTGREDFNDEWLEKTLSGKNLKTEDIQATLLEFTAKTISNTIGTLPQTVNEVYICGGGAYNTQLILRLGKLLSPRLVANTEQLGIPAQWVEGVAFAWLAKQTMERKPGNLTSVTGASEAVILGAIYQA
ncbi:MAG: anhydro-N-acetylmuramic acid kinase [Pseudomonadales bacterium]